MRPSRVNRARSAAAERSAASSSGVITSLSRSSGQTLSARIAAASLVSSAVTVTDGSGTAWAVTVNPRAPATARVRAPRSPITVTEANAPVGTYLITARRSDENGVKVSKPVYVIVQPPFLKFSSVDDFSDAPTAFDAAV